MNIKFTKMHGLGNDFVLIDNRNLSLKKLPALSKKLCDRRFGIGADQLLLLEHSKTADFKMRIFNADGPEVEMCGNGIRCLGKYIWDNVLSDSRITQLAVETMAGIMYIQKAGRLYKVDMGEPLFEPIQIPVNTSLIKGKSNKSILKEYPLKVKDRSFRLTCVSMGNPHAVTFVKNVKTVRLDDYGPLIEHHTLFPKRTNVEFIQVVDKKNIIMRVWERGSGETMACGTGASASAVASGLLGLTDRKVYVHLPGGKLLIHWSDKDNHVYMTGNAVTVFEGSIEI